MEKAPMVSSGKVKVGKKALKPYKKPKTKIVKIAKQAPMAKSKALGEPRYADMGTIRGIKEAYKDLYITPAKILFGKLKRKIRR